MKTKTKNQLQFCILISIITIEIFGFSDQLKYEFSDYLFPSLTEFLICNLLWIKIGVIGLLFLSILCLLHELKRKDVKLFFIVFLIKGFQKKSSNFIGLANTLFVGYSMAVIFKEFGLRNNNGILNGLIYLGFLLVYSMVIANYFVKITPKGKIPKPKILITALSLIRKDNLQLCLNEMEKEDMKDKWKDQVFYNLDGSIYKIKQFIFGPWANFDPIRKSIIVHNESLEQIILISSNEANDTCKELPENLQPKVLINDFIKKCYPNRKIQTLIVADGKSGNSMVENGFTLECIIKSLMNQGYKDEDIIFNVTGGTVAISGAMFLEAIPEDRLAEYTNQDTGLLEYIPLTIFSIKYLWNELLEKVE